MHNLLARRIRRHFGSGEIPESMLPLLQAVDEAYCNIDADRNLAERSMEIATRELTQRTAEANERNAQLQAAHADLRRLADQLELRVAERTAELTAANENLKTDISLRREAEEALRVAEAKYRTMFQSATNGIFQTSADGHYLGCNPALACIYGYESPEHLQNSVKDIKRQLYVEDGVRQRFIDLMARDGYVNEFESRIYRRDGSIIWISESARVVRDSAGSFLYYEGFVTDITSRKLAEEKLRESEERYALAVCGANDGLWDWNLRTGEVYYSTRWKEMLGRAADQISALPEEWFKRVHPDDLDSLQTAIAAHRQQITPHLEVEHRLKHTDGGYRWMLVRGIAITDEAGQATRLAGSFTDITARKLAEEQLIRDALHDSLTGLPNRALFLDRLERSILRKTRDTQHTFAALFIDLDRFKVINDSLGHHAGDELLLVFAQRLGRCVRPTDTICRLGGDEFTVLLEDPREPDDAAGVAERILYALKQPFVIEGQEIFVTASIGIALSDGGYTRPQDVLRDADTAMYRAKAQGKARYQVFDAAMHTRAVKLLQIENDLRRAIDRNEFEMFYQPIVRIGPRNIKGFEALVRWRHPERGLISPADFIPVAEETGLIIPLGKWILFEACRQAAAWHREFPSNPMDININLSGRQFSQSDLVEQVMDVLHQTQLPAKHLTLEITESVAMEHPDASVAMMERLKALGIQINIDDFGTGYSSLAYLQRLPLDAIKIDRSFIARMGQGTDNDEIIRTIVALAHTLKMKVTAEGIETLEQLNELESLNCENAQGFFLSRPIDSGAATEMLRQSTAPAEGKIGA
jgi:diguanylate cyclase (GGDEF)-like protein/PAS domain S-box-containing protein